MSDQQAPDAGQFEYPDGSTPPIDPDTGLPILEDRSADFPEEDADAIEVIAEPVFSRQTGTGSGMAAPYGLMAKRAARRLGVEYVPEVIEDEQSPDGSSDATGEPAGDDDPDEGQNGTEDGTEGLADGDESNAEPDADDSTEDDAEETPAEGTPEEVTEDDEPEDDIEVPDGGYDPTDHTVAEVQAYLADNTDQTNYVLDRERTGKARVSLIGA